MYGYGYGDMPFTVEDLAALKRQSMLSSAGGLLNQQMKGAYDSATQGLKDAVANYGTQYNAYKSNYDNWKNKLTAWENWQDTYIKPRIDEYARSAAGTAWYTAHPNDAVTLPTFMYQTGATQPDPKKMTQAQVNAIWAAASPTNIRHSNNATTSWWGDFAADEQRRAQQEIANYTASKPVAPATVAPTIAQFSPEKYTPVSIDPSITAFLDKGINQELRKVKTQNPGTPEWLASAKGAKLQSKQADDMLAAYNTQQQALAGRWNLPNTNYGSAFSQWNVKQPTMSSAAQAYVNEWNALDNAYANRGSYTWSSSPLLMFSATNKYGTSKQPDWSDQAGGTSYARAKANYNSYMTGYLNPLIAQFKAAVGEPSTGDAMAWYGYAAPKPTLSGYAPNAADYYSVPTYQQVATPDQSYLNKVRRIQEMQTRLGG